MNSVGQLNQETNEIAEDIHHKIHINGIIQYNTIVYRIVTGLVLGLACMLFIIYLVIKFISNFDNLFAYYYGFDTSTCSEMINTCDFVAARMRCDDQEDMSESGLDMEHFNFRDTNVNYNDGSDEIVLKATRKKTENVNSYIKKFKVLLLLAGILNSIVINSSNYIFYSILVSTTAPLAYKSIVTRSKHFFGFGEMVLKAAVYNHEDLLWQQGENYKLGLKYLRDEEVEILEVISSTYYFVPDSSETELLWIFE